MMIPRVWGEDLFDDWMDFPFDMFGKGKNPLYGKHAKNMMKTDVRETDSSYELDIDLPGFKKDEISAVLEDGYLENGILKLFISKKSEKEAVESKNKIAIEG